MNLPRYTKKDEQQLAAELASEDNTLAADLYKHLIWCLHEGQPIETAFTEGHAYRWVMDLSWLNECRRMALQLSGGRASYQNAEAQRAEADYLLGLPIDVREGGGVPHLETA